MDPFATLIPDARAFLGDLAANNTRDWFAAHKAGYQARLKRPATLLLDQLAQEFGCDKGTDVRTKLFRPHRDVRFSKDKTPYTTHLHMLWSFPGPRGAAPGLFFGISPDYVTLGGGVMGFDKPGLEQWRRVLDCGQGDRIADTLDALVQQGFDLRAPELKRVPAPYPPDHPRADLLRHKALTVWRDVPQDQWDVPLAAVKAAHLCLAPLFRLLGEHV